MERLRATGTGLPIEVEAETLDDVREAVAAGAEQILLETCPWPSSARPSHSWTEGDARGLGGVSLGTVREIAEGASISLGGRLDYSARSLDVAGARISTTTSRRSRRKCVPSPRSERP